jgi:hypothetical protein
MPLQIGNNVQGQILIYKALNQHTRLALRCRTKTTPTQKADSLQHGTKAYLPIWDEGSASQLLKYGSYLIFFLRNFTLYL